MTTLMKRNGTSLFPQLPVLSDDPFIRNWFNWSNSESNDTTGSVPAVNIRETNDSYEISVAAPGMQKSDFKVELENNRLIISAEKKEQHEHKEGESYLRQEYNYQSFVRTFSLAEKQVSSDKIKAGYTNGILHITLPKSPEAKSKAARVIQVS